LADQVAFSMYHFFRSGDMPIDLPSKKLFSQVSAQ